MLKTFDSDMFPNCLRFFTPKYIHIILHKYDF
jgi:hypothetical protein